MSLALIASAVGQDQSSITGGLNGAIVDATGAVVVGATVTLVGPQGTTKLTTDKLGRFSATTLRPGFYDVTVEKSGFAKVQAKHSEVTVNSSSTLNLTLSTGNVDTVVEVSSSAVAIDTQSTAVTTTLSDTFYNSVPMPRNVSAIFYAAPGVQSGQVAGSANQAGPGASNPSIGGASALENLYVVDGVTITDQAFGSIGTFNRYHGALGTGINLAFIKEVDVKTTAFEPQYGKATGGIVQIVTKSGSNAYHGALSAYFAPSGLFASRYQYYQFGYQLSTPSQTLAQPAYDAAAEFGGYVPHFKDKLFFFGAFDPALTQSFALANPSAPSQAYALGVIHSSTTAVSYAGKLTYRPNSRITLEVSGFGDPSRHNSIPSTLSTAAPTTTASSWNYGSQDEVARLDLLLTPSWTADVSYSYNHNHFTEKPSQPSLYGFTDQTKTYLPTPGAAVASGLGAYEPSKNNTYSIAFNTEKIVHLFGQHTLSVGYAYDHTNFHDEPTRSGALFPIPSVNYLGGSLATGSFRTSAIGQLTDAQFYLVPANTANLTDHTCTQCPTVNGEVVYASSIRGQYTARDVDTQARYHSAYGNDSYEVNRYVTLSAGVRWEQQRIAGPVQSYALTGNWSPRVGITIDPLGDHKSKLFFNYGRNYWAIPLDAAIRELGGEQDSYGFKFIPTILADGTPTVTADSAHLLNGTPQKTSTTTGAVSNFGAPTFNTGGEGIMSGTKSEYEQEYVIGYERNLGNSIVAKIRYTDRRLGRVIEDIGSESPEGAVILGGYNGGIANPSAKTDIAINEQEVTYTQAQFLAANPGTVTAATYKAPVTGCTYATDTYSAIGGPFLNSTNQPVGGACFLNAATADNGPGDGLPDGFVNPVRRYNAIEFELDKRFSNHWLAVTNFKWGNLWGNYEGAYRNDNGQSDPGISSLFDFTTGKLGLLGDQFTPGFLSTDRRAVGNVFLSYNIGADTPFFHGARGLTVGLGARGQSGVPLSRLGDHPIYLNQGEVPVGGRGAAGRTPSTTQLDAHADYSVPLGARFSERYKLKLTFDAFNVTNSQFETGRLQYLQLANSGVGAAPALDADYGRPTSFQAPFNSRASIRFEF